MRFEYQGRPAYGVLEAADLVRVYEGDIFDDAWPTGA
ncbi:MAG: Rv2993c-like domain-containing protein, partial [Burkholderiales bacterium]